jgi:hypothetical protein
MSNNLLTENLSAPLNGATAANLEIDTGTGNLTVDELAENTQVLASGALQYFEKQGPPTEFVSAEGRKATVRLTATAAGRPWFRLPWAGCLGGTEWQIHLNPSVSSEITAHTGGGNVKLNLPDMALTGVSADTGGGNMDIILPEHAADLRVKTRTGGGNISIEVGDTMTGSNTVEANSGAGNVVVQIPRSIPARVDASTGLGKVLMETRFSKIGAHLYQSADYETAVNKLDITVHSGAGNVSVTTKVRAPARVQQKRGCE